jgi:Zn-dependent protease with chaperone function
MRFTLITSLFCLLIAASGHSAAQELLVHSDSLSITAEQTGTVAVPVPTEKAMDYYHSGNILWIVGILWGILIPVLFLFTGLSARIRNWAQKIGKKWFWIIGIYFVFFSLMMFVIDSPLNYYQEFVRQHAYGLSNQTLGKWIGDSLTSLMVGIIIGFLFLWLPYLALKKSPKRWWLYVGIGTAPFLFLTLLISPIWIDPLFNDYGPMKDKVLETKILALAERAGIEGSKVFEVNKSVDTKTLNASVTGFLGTKRIVIWDNTLAKMNERELMFVLGHEMGHYLLGHIWKLIFFYSFLFLVTLYIAHRTAATLIDKFKHRFGFEELSDIASFPLIILLINLFGFILIDPVGNWFMRSLEHQADQFGLEITKDNHNAATAFVKLQAENLSNPRPGTLYKIWRMSHPLLGDRIEYANEYKPWLKKEKLEFEEYFKK